MKTARIEDSIVVEIIPDYALPVAEWYGTDFAERCIDAADAVEQGFIYRDGKFLPPEPQEPPAPSPTNTELAAQLAQTDDTAISLYEKQLAQDTINASVDDALIALYERGGTK